MSIFHSYLKKNDTLISSNLTNNSLNPVHEIFYGSVNKQVSRFIFDIDLEPLQTKISSGLINPNRITKHVLHMTNTIANASQYIGKRSYSLNIERASAFSLDFFNINEDWDEGAGYDFSYSNNQTIYVDTVPVLTPEQIANWEKRKAGTDWTVAGGSYISGITNIIGSQEFNMGNENIELDITDYLNQRLLGTGYTGTTIYNGDTFGIGIKFPDDIEDLQTEFINAVAFHAKHTNTFYEPYIETIIDDTITDDRNYFFLDKDNDLYLYSNIGNSSQDIIVNKVDIYDHEDNIVTSVSGNNVTHVSKGIYKITLNIDSQTYPDAVLFRDLWTITVNNKQVVHENEFYLISPNRYYNFNLSNQINFANYYFNFWGINENEKIIAGVIKKIRLSLKELYPNQNNFLPLEIEYRVYITVGSKYEIDVIPFTAVNRTSTGFEFNLDTSWLIPQDYYLQIRMKNGNYYENKQSLLFTIASNGIM